MAASVCAAVKNCLKSSTLCFNDKLLFCVTVIIIGKCEIWKGYEIELMTIIMFFVGIPHGAADTLMYQQIINQNNRNNYYFKNIKIVLFYVIYVSLCLLYGVLWYVMPQLSFVIFILISSYHFGSIHFIDEIKQMGNNNNCYVSFLRNFAIHVQICFSRFIFFFKC